MTARSPRASAALSSSPIAVLLPVPVVPMNLKCLLSSANGTGTPGEGDAVRRTARTAARRVVGPARRGSSRLGDQGAAAPAGARLRGGAPGHHPAGAVAEKSGESRPARQLENAARAGPQPLQPRRQRCHAQTSCHSHRCCHERRRQPAAYRRTPRAIVPPAAAPERPQSPTSVRANRAGVPAECISGPADTARCHASSGGRAICGRDRTIPHARRAGGARSRTESRRR